MTSKIECLYVVDDETVIPCEHNHRVIIFMTLDKTKAEKFLEKHYTLKIREIPLDVEAKSDYGVLAQ